MFSSVLVANRGEIAVRIIRTLRRLGIRAVLVASLPDRASLAACQADAVVLLEGHAPGETYLDAGAIIAAAEVEGCEAIHPGYGFLSERAEFAERCAAAGVVFIGPPPGALRSLGDKASARQLAVRAGVPVVPGWDGEGDDDATLIREATGVGFPLMLKARGGGGGRGMREVHDQSLLPEAITSGRREALAAFGDPGLLLERLVRPAHHVEVQVIADAHGNVIHLGERDCSVQRRRQKLIEESPSPAVDPSLREALCQAAVRLVREAGYVNAGTVEFLVQPGAADPFFFLEVNPRLQVEHPVTELRSGFDLVELQLRVAAGESLPVAQDGVRLTGHAFELRLNAEDPSRDFLPSGGRLSDVRWPAGARVDAGYATGDVVPADYDSLLAKLIVRGESRAEALERAGAALRDTVLDGVATNAGLLRSVLLDAEFANHRVSTDWLEANLDDLLEGVSPPGSEWVAAAAALTAPRSGGAWDGSGWIGAGRAVAWLASTGEVREVAIVKQRPGVTVVTVGDEQVRVHWRPGEVVALVARGPVNERIPLMFAEDGSSVATGACRFRLVSPPPLPRAARAAAGSGSVVEAPLAGRVVAVEALAGAAVEAGQLLVVVEAMKMEHRLVAPGPGTIAEVLAAEGDLVAQGQVLVRIA